MAARTTTTSIVAATPANRAHLESFQFEKHVTHQDGMAGTLSIRLVEARNLRAASSMFFVRTCNPYVIFRIGKMNVRSSTIVANDNPSWGRREKLEMKIPKLDHKRSPLDDHSDIRMELIVDAMNEDSLTGKTTEYVGMQNGSVIGTAVVDFTALLEGKEEVMDRWITLTGGIPVVNPSDNVTSGKKPKRAPEKAMDLGEVRIILHYEPHGMEPQVGDVVKLEGFGAYPSALLAPVDELELHVKKISGNYLLCSYLTKSGFEGAMRLHRNNVFVAHRNSLLDRLYVSCIAEPFEFVRNTPIGQSAGEVLKPYMNVARTFSFPALKAAKATVITTFRASTAALGAVVASME
uniref:C2 domain-containing protein n=1 Tax=Globisporangium ultimum (strain ATCC 200006 / CBS 805.95 / DAOM BR144) TaxID=431595 RepID=K3WX24_GLOUD